MPKSVKKEANRIKLGYFLYQFECLPFDAEATSCYGDIRVQLESTGTQLAPLDTLIAAHALSLAANIVTNNVLGFEHVDGLAIENWISQVLESGKPGEKPNILFAHQKSVF